MTFSGRNGGFNLPSRYGFGGQQRESAMRVYRCGSEMWSDAAYQRAILGVDCEL